MRRRILYCQNVVMIVLSCFKPRGLTGNAFPAVSVRRMVQTIGRIWPVYFSLGTLLVPLAYNCNSATEAFMFMYRRNENTCIYSWR